MGALLLLLQKSALNLDGQSHRDVDLAPANRDSMGFDHGFSPRSSLPRGVSVTPPLKPSVWTRPASCASSHTECRGQLVRHASMVSA